MIKKLLLVAVVGAIAFTALKGSKFIGYAKQEVAEAQSWMESQVPVEKEIARLRKEVGSLEKDRSKVADLLAKEIVECRYLREDVEKLRAEVRVEDDRLRAKADEIKDSTERVKYGRTMVSLGEAKDMLKADVARHMNRKASLSNQEKALNIREQNKENLERQLDVLKRQKDELAVQIDAFEAEYRSLQLEQMQSKYQTDATRLANIKNSLRGLEKKMAIEREKLNLAPRVVEDSGFTASGETVDEIIAPLDASPKTGADGKVSSVK